MRENVYVESNKALRANEERRAADRQKAITEAAQKRNDFMNNYHTIRESRASQAKKRSELMEACRNNALSTALKAIYITALEAETLTDNGIMLAESMVDNYIKENGGASKILGAVKNDTYLLARLHQIVEDAAEDEVKEIENIEADKEEEKKEDKEEKLAEEEPKKEEEPAKEDSEKKEEEPKAEEKPAEEEPEKEEPAKETDPLTDTSFEDDEVEIPDDATNSSDDTETDTAEDIVDDLEEVPEEDITVDGDTENGGKVFDELEKEEDIKKAIELIRNRVADAEETFIKRNAEDKKAIDELIGRISDNVKTVEDLDDEAKSAVAQEAARMNRRKIAQITENRPLSIFEKMTRNIAAGIAKDTVLKEQYLTEDGNMDMHLVVESAKVMYGFLETVNTLQLEKVDSAYITRVLKGMN